MKNTSHEAPEYAAFSMILVDAVEKRRISSGSYNLLTAISAAGLCGSLCRAVYGLSDVCRRSFELSCSSPVNTESLFV
jgi:hypothetical protein